jgi:tRNA 2-thiouridine synthesizing protein A
VNPETPDLVLDCRGMRCPRPIIELARHIDEVSVGDVIAVASDDVAAATDVPAWARLREQEFLGARNDEDGVPVYRVRRLR